MLLALGIGFGQSVRTLCNGADLDAVSSPTVGGKLLLVMRCAHEVTPGSLRLFGTVFDRTERTTAAAGIPARLAQPEGRSTSSASGGRSSWRPVTILLHVLIIVSSTHVIASASLALLWTAFTGAQSVVRFPLRTAASIHLCAATIGGSIGG
jgi:hypothetical protein